jgi:hypothetical protein
MNEPAAIARDVLDKNKNVLVVVSLVWLRTSVRLVFLVPSIYVGTSDQEATDKVQHLLHYQMS